jgi:hypothetical protein
MVHAKSDLLHNSVFYFDLTFNSSPKERKLMNYARYLLLLRFPPQKPARMIRPGGGWDEVTQAQ